MCVRVRVWWLAEASPCAVSNSDGRGARARARGRPAARPGAGVRGAEVAVRPARRAAGDHRGRRRVRRADAAGFADQGAVLQHRPPQLKKLLVDFVCMATGGPCKYEGRDMETSHAGMDLVDDEFTALVEDLVGALDKFKVPEKEKNELLGALGPLKPQIVIAGGQAKPIERGQARQGAPSSPRRSRTRRRRSCSTLRSSPASAASATMPSSCSRAPRWSPAPSRSPRLRRRSAPARRRA